MKFKNIASAGHNFCHSFLSLMNYNSDQDTHIIDTVMKVRGKGYVIEIVFLSGEVQPDVLNSIAFQRNLGFYLKSLPESFESQHINLEMLSEFKLIWPLNEKLPLYHIQDSRGKEYSGSVKTHGN